MHNIGFRQFIQALVMFLVHAGFALGVLLSSIWLCLALWIQLPGGKWTSIILISLWALFALSILGIYVSQHVFSRQKDRVIYLLVFALSLLWYFNIPAKQDRDWDPEVSRIFNYQKQGSLVTINNVRNFAWKSDGRYDERWESRKYDLDQLTGVNVITSYWMGPQIAHTLVSFDFANQRPLVFSIEIRKERQESFSAIGGFFRQFELSLIAADEEDIVYTRSNIRHEQVYFFPVKMPKAAMQALFIEYLKKSDELAATPKWYNTVTSNCTTIIFDMAQAIEESLLPKDYRLLVSGYLPNYLYDIGVLDQRWDMAQWYQHAHINPRTADLNLQQDQTGLQYSKRIRQGLLQPQALENSAIKP
ncbi:Lnb N-terminal periplasmic domain-containing protein [Acinetobacter rudis]|uniref:Lnb N-terminal periplasmic domain-containing protein n=1 Tax=Acinetobacter rudis CIP 110305 TaxID=421052 RepID=S3P1R1_9GAMM|nr:DUF4105 domain-containing protein [Acinetobacter rudis]EPF80354.1 hypothetical protein F945_00492 [Acinetobacter rudis CIP 110305]